MITIKKVKAETRTGRRDYWIEINDDNFLAGAFDIKKLPQVIEGLEYLEDKNFGYKKITIQDNGTIIKEK